MAIIVDEATRLVVQGLTGREGSFHASRNKAYGTQVVAGVTPGKGGQEVEGIPVFDTVAAAVAETRAHTASSAKEMLRRFYFDTITHEPQALRYLIDLVGAERIVVGTDSPFDMGDERPRATLSHLTPEEVATLRRNALRLLEE